MTALAADFAVVTDFLYTLPMLCSSNSRRKIDQPDPEILRLLHWPIHKPTLIVASGLFLSAIKVGQSCFTASFYLQNSQKKFFNWSVCGFVKGGRVSKREEEEVKKEEIVK